MEWGKSWRGSNTEYINNAIQLSNSHYFFSGEDEDNPDLIPLIVVLADSNGSIIAQKSFAHATYSIQIYGSTESADGKIFMTGRLERKCLIVKMDSSANLEWAKYYDYESLFFGYSIARATSGNGVVLTGKADVSNGFDIFVMEVDSDGLLASSAGSYYPTSVNLTESSFNFTVTNTNGNPTDWSYKTTKEGIQFLDMEVQQTFQYPAGREGSSYVPGTSDASSSLSSISSQGFNEGLIVGVVVGILALAAVIIIIVWCCNRMKKQLNSSDQHLAVQMEESEFNKNYPLALNAASLTEPLCQPMQQPLQHPQPIRVPGVINQPSVVTMSQSGQPYAPPQNAPYTAQPINE